LVFFASFALLAIHFFIHPNSLVEQYPEFIEGQAAFVRRIETNL